MVRTARNPRAGAGSAQRKEIASISSRCIQCQEPGCTGGCPLGVGIPSILSLTSSGKLEEAAALLRLRSPLASITGRICPSDRFCEHACILARKGMAVSFHDLESRLGDISLSLPTIRGKNARGSVLVIGSGPAGLTAAHDLHVEGFMVTVYEKEPFLGGWLRSLPADIIPPHVLDSEIERLALSGISFVTSRTFRAGDGLPPANYSALVLATGPPLPNSRLPQVKKGDEGFIMVDHQYRTSRPSVYASGGTIARYNSITEAMASSREMAGHLLRAHLFPPV